MDDQEGLADALHAHLRLRTLRSALLTVSRSAPPQTACTLHADALLNSAPPSVWSPWTALLLALGLLLGACAAAPPPPPPVDFTPAAYRRFVVPQPLLPFSARGSAAVTWQGERESGELVLRGGQSRNGSSDPTVALELRARVTGSLALELRFDADTLLVVDYLNDGYFRGSNTADTRLRLFGVDLTPAEFILMVTGRAPHAWVDAGRSETLSDGALLLHQGATQYHFLFDSQGLPAAWEKRRGGELLLRVVYRAYRDQQVNGGSLRLPRQIRVYRQQEETPLLVLGFAEFGPGDDGTPTPSPWELPPAARDFGLLVLPPR